MGVVMAILVIMGFCELLETHRGLCIGLVTVMLILECIRICILVPKIHAASEEKRIKLMKVDNWLLVLLAVMTAGVMYVPVNWYLGQI